MASLNTAKNNTRSIRTVPCLGRKVIRLGHCTAKQARAVHAHIEHLEAQAITGHPAPDATQRWLREIDAKLLERVARAGLTEIAVRYTLATWIAARIKHTEKTAVKGTITRLRQSERAAMAYFGEDKLLHKITPGEAHDYAANLASGKLATATIRKRIGDLKQWLGQAVRHRLIDRNPFDGIKTSVPPTEHHAYISDDKAAEVMDKLPTVVIRAAFALSRWGGLRSFSEHTRLKWSDIDWHKERFIVNGKGGVRRTVPLFPELVIPLTDLYDITAEGAIEVFPGMSADSAYHRRAVERAIKDAGHKQWPRLFHNLRASRQTDLIDRYGMQRIKTICSWLGNSEQEAIKSYMIERGREEAFAEASASGMAESAAPSGHKGGHRPSKNPTAGADNRGSGVQSDPYGAKTHSAIALLLRRLAAEQPQPVAASAPVDDQIAQAVATLTSAQRGHLAAVLKHLAKDNVPQ